MPFAAAYSSRDGEQVRVSPGAHIAHSSSDRRYLQYLLTRANPPCRCGDGCSRVTSFAQCSERAHELQAVVVPGPTASDDCGAASFQAGVLRKRGH